MSSISENRFTQRAQAALRLAQEASAQLGHGYVGSEHLLLGLSREGQGVAAKVLRNAGLEPETIRSSIARLVGVGAPVPMPSQGLTPGAKRSLSWPCRRPPDWATATWAPSTCCWACCGRGTAWPPGSWRAAAWSSNGFTTT